MKEAPSQRRENDPDDTDYTLQRRASDEQELSLGAGKYRLVIRGGTVINVVVGLAALAAVALHINEQAKANQGLIAHISEVTNATQKELNRTIRLQTCVLSLTAEERIEWRRRTDAATALTYYCPGLLLVP